jgi:hypothetical protein
MVAGKGRTSSGTGDVVVARAGHVDRSDTASAVPTGEGPVHSGSAPAERSGRSAHSMEDVHRDQESSLWERMLSKENLLAALGRVEVNRGAPGVDGMATAELRPWLLVHWPVVRAELDAGTYRPSPVRQVIIPKPGGGERILGVPRVLDRLIQQAVAQVLVPIFDRRVLRFRLFCRTSCSTIWTGSCSGAVTGSCVTPTMFASSCGADEPP